MPQSGDLDRAFAEIEKSGEILLLKFPGPLEGHLRPTTPIPQDFFNTIEKSSTKETGSPILKSFEFLSQIFALGT